jgi:hypothetical protein
MKKKTHRKEQPTKSILRLPDLEVAKTAVINSLSCPDAQRALPERCRLLWGRYRKNIADVIRYVKTKSFAAVSWQDDARNISGTK